MTSNRAPLTFLQKVKRLTAAVGVIGSATVLASDNTYRRQLAAHAQPYHATVFNYAQGPRKRDLFRTMRGDVLELGPGSGANFAHFPDWISWSGVERNPHVLPLMQVEAGRYGFAPKALDVKQRSILGHLQRLPSNSQNCVLATLVLGTNPEDHMRISEEIHRVLRPGGKFYFVERTASPNPIYYGLQWLVSPFSRLLNIGVDPTADLLQSLLRLEFSDMYVEQWPGWRHRDNHRQGIRLLTFDASNRTLEGLSGLNPLVAGMAVKAYDRQSAMEAHAKAQRDNGQFSLARVLTAHEVEE